MVINPYRQWVYISKQEEGIVVEEQMAETFTLDEIAVQTFTIDQISKVEEHILDILTRYKDILLAEDFSLLNITYFLHQRRLNEKRFYKKGNLFETVVGP